MDDLNEKLAGILNDPDSMEKVRRMAESLLGEEKSKENKQGGDFSALSGLFGTENTIDPMQLTKIVEIMNRFKNKGNDPRTALLQALRQNLSEDRRKKVDIAIKILQFIDILPHLKETGILNL
ncbi:MAG: hypothetical protein J6J13_05540 [Clostridia bacterium]|nr:hypothetical protein [Clostridia bacterium]